LHLSTTSCRTLTVWSGWASEAKQGKSSSSLLHRGKAFPLPGKITLKPDGSQSCLFIPRSTDFLQFVYDGLTTSLVFWKINWPICAPVKLKN